MVVIEGQLLAVGRDVMGYSVVIENSDGHLSRQLTGLNRADVQGLTIGQRVRVTVETLPPEAAR